MRKIGFAFVLSAVLALVLHAGHPDAAHLGSKNHDCGICQVVTLLPNPVTVVHTPVFRVAETVHAHFVVVTKKSLSLLADLRGPPAA